MKLELSCAHPKDLACVTPRISGDVFSTEKHAVLDGVIPIYLISESAYIQSMKSTFKNSAETNFKPNTDQPIFQFPYGGGRGGGGIITARWSNQV